MVSTRSVQKRRAEEEEEIEEVSDIISGWEDVRSRGRYMLTCRSETYRRVQIPSLQRKSRAAM